MVNSTLFTFLRTSELGSTPLISTLKIGSVSQSLNGTKIVCTEVGASAMKANTTVYIIRNIHGRQIISGLEIYMLVYDNTQI